MLCVTEHEHPLRLRYLGTLHTYINTTARPGPFPSQREHSAIIILLLNKVSLILHRMNFPSISYIMTIVEAKLPV